MRHDIANTATGSGGVGENDGSVRVVIEDTVTSTPAIAVDGTMYVGTLTGLVALDVDGVEQWRFETCPSTARALSAEAQERCIGTPVGPIATAPAVTAGDQVVPIATSGCIFSVKDEKEGDLRFTCEWAALPAPSDCDPSATESCAASSPQVLVDSRDLSLTSVFFGTADGGLQALNGDGTSRWRFPSRGKSLGGPITSTPAIGLNAILVAGPDLFLYALDFAGRVAWTAPIPVAPGGADRQPSPAASLSAYLPNGGAEIIAYNFDGTTKWSFTTAGQIVGSPAVASQIIEQSDGSSDFEPIVYALDETGILYGLRDADGTVVGLQRCSLSNDSCNLDTCDMGEGTCIDGICSISGASCSGDSCGGDDGTCVIKPGLRRIAPEGSEVVTSPSVSGDLFAIVGTQGGSVCVQRLDGELPDAEAWQSGCVSLDSGAPIVDPPVVDSRGRLFVVSGSTLYAIE